MSAPESGQAAPTAALTPLPRLEDLPTDPSGGYAAEGVRDAFDAFRRHALQIQAQLRVLQAAGTSGNVDPTGHAVRMDALHLIRAAAEFADVLERDALTASATQIGRTEVEVRARQRELQAREAELEAHRADIERQSNELLNAAKADAREVRAKAEREAAAELREAEARGTRLVEQSRHQATELTNAARAEVEQTLDWARAHASAVIARAQEATEELLKAAGLGPEALAEVSSAILQAARASFEQSSSPKPSDPAGATQAEVEQTLEWARAQAASIIARAQEVAEELLTAAGLGPEALAEVSAGIVQATRSPDEPGSRAQAPAADPSAPETGASAAPERPEAPPAAPQPTPEDPTEESVLGEKPE